MTDFIEKTIILKSSIVDSMFPSYGIVQIRLALQDWTKRLKLNFWNIS